jgi:hypothetical protein
MAPKTRDNSGQDENISNSFEAYSEAGPKLLSL